MELRVNEVAIPEKIDFNYEELKAELTSKVSFYGRLSTQMTRSRMQRQTRPI